MRPNPWIVVLFALFAVPTAEGRIENPCPVGMVPTGHGSCIDRFEYPNQPGVKPLLGVSGIAEPEDQDAGVVIDAEQLCARSGKRVCRRDEWISACKGPEGAPYPFGRKLPKYDPNQQDGLCNYDKLFLSPNETKVYLRDPDEMV